VPAQATPTGVAVPGRQELGAAADMGDRKEVVVEEAEEEEEFREEGSQREEGEEWGGGGGTGRWDGCGLGEAESLKSTRFSDLYIVNILGH
jgi:hypothetical protein